MSELLHNIVFTLIPMIFSGYFFYQVGKAETQIKNKEMEINNES